MRVGDIKRLALGTGAALALALAGCGGDGKTKQAAPGPSSGSQSTGSQSTGSQSTGSQSSGSQSSGSQSSSSGPTSEQTHAAGIPNSHDDQRAYFIRVYCVGDSQTQCKCKLESMGGNDESTFGTVLYKLKRSDPATVLRFGRASTGCA